MYLFHGELYNFSGGTEDHGGTEDQDRRPALHAIHPSSLLTMKQGLTYFLLPVGLSSSI